MKSFYIVAATLLLGVLSLPSTAQMRIVELGYETSPRQCAPADFRSPAN